MKAIEPADLWEWLIEEWLIAEERFNMTEAERADETAMLKHYDHEHAQMFVGETASQRLERMRVYDHTLGHCPRCGTRYAELTYINQPDMVGEIIGYQFECCGYDHTECTALEYADEYVPEDEDEDDPSSDYYWAKRHRRHVDIR